MISDIVEILFSGNWKECISIYLTLFFFCIVEDYRLSAAIAVLRWIIMKQDGDLDIDLSDDVEEKKEDKEAENTDGKKSK